MKKIRIEDYRFNLSDNGYEVDYWQEEEDHSCFVSLAEIQNQVCEKDGTVSTAIISPYTQEIIAERAQSFQEYMDTDFNGREAERILSLIILKKEVCHA